MNENMPALVGEPVSIFVLLLLLTCGAICLGAVARFQPVTKVLPAPIWIYFLAVTLASVGVLPAESVTYEAMAFLLVPLSLFLLTASSDFRSVKQVGPTALTMLLAGSLGVVLGGLVAFVSVAPYLAEGVWKGFAVLAGAWIGGSANGIAVQQGLDAAPEIIGPLIIVDSLMGYFWIVFLLFLGTRQAWLSRLFRYEPAVGRASRTVTSQAVERKALTLPGLAAVVGLGVLATALTGGVGGSLPELGEPTVVSGKTWTILLVVALGVACSFTRARAIEAHGASDIGYFCMLLLLATLGARGNFSAFLQAPLFLVSGALWLSIHLLVLVGVARFFRISPALVAIGSAANIGGFVTAPLVALAFDRKLVPTALLMAAVAQVLGIYLPFLLASVLADLSGPY
ncbi:MAG: DUF819 family protein [Pseudomonadota bacterium]